MAVELVPYTPRWCSEFALEASALRKALGDTIVAIHHIGSTAIPGILAKPVIDVLCVVTSLAAVDAAAPRMQVLGYTAKGEHGIAGRRYFQKKDSRGVRSHHVHVFCLGADHIEGHLAFRDFLLAHPTKAAQYAEMKALALANHLLTRQAYQESKKPFIFALLPEAIRWYRLQRGH
ncbi:protein of unknown function UPF0157 [Hymenobacter roseosalivarius DSM 11622]|uniref:GrpB family protein n=1 Tax=Hymenobacter roseosalivarius DSM 11622 TaxID=645990 RepID=A0A1W1W508_9BACT|nr:GrpB family protein [Hymenobacter roseosalivarius]SMC00708.1 protein of unknown function UPF0157 [Hymenobacter roseosalivarius DSM 11622]